MRKLFTLFAAAVSALAINATEVVLWEGESVIQNWGIVEGSTRALAMPSDFVDAQIGDKLIINYQIEADVWVEFWAADMSTTLSSLPGGNFSASETSRTIVINDAVLAQLNQYGVTLSSGNRLTVTAIILDMAADPEGPMTIWEGEHVYATAWDANEVLSIPASYFGTLAGGDILIFEIKDVTARDTCLALKDPDWGDLPANITWGNYLYFNPGDASVTFTVNDDCAPLIKENGLLLLDAANSFTLTRVLLKSSGEMSGINAVSAQVNVNAGVYNLQGIRVANSLSEISAPGLYISNGSKYLVK